MEKLTNSEFLIVFGKNLKKLRKNQGFTQAELANDLGIEISQISRIERGVINTSVGLVNQIAEALGINIIELFVFK